MFEPIDLLRTYLQGIRYFTGAVSASLFVPAKLGRSGTACLLHSGDHRVLPELEDLDTAQEWAGRADAWIEESVSPGPGSMPFPFASGIVEGALFALPDLGSLEGLAQWAAGDKALSRSDRDSGAKPEETSVATDRAAVDVNGAWIGLRFAPGTGSALENLANKNRQITWIREGSQEDRLRWLFAMGGALASHSARVAAALRDRQTGLLNRAGLQALIAEKLEGPHRAGGNFSLLMLNPDDFRAVNETLGRSAGERCVREIADRLSSTLSSGQIASRFGGVIFAVLLAGINGKQARSIAEELRRALSESPYLDDTVNLSFSCGVSSWNPKVDTDVGQFELTCRADLSLKRAKETGGGTVASWTRGQSAGAPNHFDRLTGIFTGNLTQDYRNMALLWEAIEAVSVGLPFEKLAVQMVDQTHRTFRARLVALYRTTAEGQLELVGERRDADCPERNLLTDPAYSRLLSRTGSEGRTQTLDEQNNGGRFAAAVRLSGQDGTVGCLFIEAQEGSPLESEDLMFLHALGSQLGVALDRALANRRKQREEDRVRRRLEGEVQDLRRTLQKGHLVYRSPEMQQLVETARRVAPLDATVLITGSSGTGKEVLAQTVHDLSLRRVRPMVVVDCGALTTTLIESELFGHEKGAYTGAQNRRQGRLLEADGGTLFLDEVGELPLEVQTKLLRFVQEQQFVAVGGTRMESVDTRIIAATNKDLEQEVANGRFREDLFYRLNVVRLHIPELKDRVGDLQQLADHFLERFANQYDRTIFGFDATGRAALHNHNWPGNVRELKNRILRACILADGELVTALDLGLAGGDTHAGGSMSAIQPEQVDLLSGLETATGDPSSGLEFKGSVLERLEAALAQQILECDGTELPPLGRWVFEDLVVEAQAAAHGVVRQAADLIGLPETTFRRRFKSLKHDERSRRWPTIRALLAEAIEGREGGVDGLANRVEQLLVAQIVEHHPRSTARGAALLGVSPPTFRSKVAKHRAQVDSTAN